MSEKAKAYEGFILKLYRVMNLQLADLLESEILKVSIPEYHSSNEYEKHLLRSKFYRLKMKDYQEYIDDEIDGAKKLKEIRKNHTDGFIMKTVLDLRLCAQLCLVELGEKMSDNKIVRSGSKCRNKYCYICNRLKSIKLSSRFQKLVNEKYSDKEYRFYFLTLTLRHRKGIREGDYLSELKDLQGKLFRSKKFKLRFRPPAGERSIGIVQSFENSIKQNGNHIHSHNMILSKSVDDEKECESFIRDWWHKKSMIILGGKKYGSTEIQLKSVGLATDNDEEVSKQVIETFKYSTKVGNTNKMNDRTRSHVVNWIKSSKSKNMMNTSGLLRGHGITSHKCSLDNKKEDSSYDDKKRYVLMRTSQTEYKAGITKLKVKTKFTKKERSLLKQVVILDKPTKFDDTVEVTDVVDMIGSLESIGVKDKEKSKMMIEALRSQKQYNNANKRDDDDWRGEGLYENPNLNNWKSNRDLRTREQKKDYVLSELQKMKALDMDINDMPQDLRDMITDLGFSL